MAQSDHPGHIRKLRSRDREAFRDHLLRLDPETRRSRFAMATNDDFIRRYAETSFKSDSIIHGCFVEGTLRGVGELRMLDVVHHDAEAAFSVEGLWQGTGIGSELMAHTLLTARNRGISRVYMSCLGSNRSMQRLARSHGAELEFDAGEVIGLVLPAQPSPSSLVREAVADSTEWATAVFDMQRRMLGVGAARS
eukprot:gene21878-22863_t